MADAQERPSSIVPSALDIVRVTEATAVAAARLRGRGDEAAADAAAINAMYRELARPSHPRRHRRGRGRGERGAAALYRRDGRRRRSSSGLEVDIAVDPVEGSTLCAKALPNALSVMAIAERGSLLKVPTIYMDKIAIGPGLRQGPCRSRRVASRQSECARQGQGRAGDRDHRLHPRPPASCQADRGGARRRRRGAADRRRRYRRRDPYDRAAGYRHRHLYGRGRRA